MAAHRVLIVEDEHDIAGLIKHTLERTGETEAEIVGSGDAALKAVADHPPDLILLDLNLPVVSGTEVCRILRSRADAKHLPIIMLTCRTSEDDRVSGLEVGADDYITKPFSLRELTARVRAALRRTAKVQEPGVAGYTGVHLVADFESVSVSVDGRAVRLTRREFELLRYLAQNKNRVISRDRLRTVLPGNCLLGRRNALGRRARRPASQQARSRRTADRDGHRPGVSIRRLTRSFSGSRNPSDS